MKKSLLFLAIACIIGLNVNAQTTIWEDNFDSYTAPTDLSTQGYVVWEGTCLAADAAGNGITAVSGTNVAKCSTGASNNVYLRKTINLEGGKQYTYSAYTMQADGKKHFIQVVVDGATLKAEGTNTTWATKSITFTPSTTQDVVLTTYLWPSGFAMYVDDMKLVEDAPTSIGDTEANQVVVAPNPSKGSFKVTGSAAIASVDVYNTSGQLVKKIEGLAQNEVSVELDNAAPGVYMVKVKAVSGENTISKVVVK
ncbi:T9SS type A sorting domain-containing protein [Labilibacter sediminis]|nr:T9SS type A sorting domain-containing protein [Labilibacter sediminis]